jgi:hypothetical protein
LNYQIVEAAQSRPRPGGWKGRGSSGCPVRALRSHRPPSAKKWLNLTSTGGKVDVLETSRGLADPIGDFIDSRQAIQVARKNGLAARKKPMMGLARMGATKGGVACWTVGGGFEPGSVGVVLNAKTGAFITKHVIE